ncbi:hypothetical protein EV643_12447 [Kribbella sp. VKM Ac-2527]|uniref:Uncharacterized protein n=1 Tax=Kribbella caucasensis TaxID=2512215 RepID=A0A4R6JJ46_9ACTN|nr:hypothetical protein [Kribbella sp. VKM Ac-2527]TDO35161.1 hypothetical protein EV643_12447 [Kribbella sp. VKM Ac-2527]
MMSSQENPYAGQGAVLLDIGGGVGALVVTMPASLAGAEIEARHVPDHGGHLSHVEVLRRPSPAGAVCSAVFGELEAGTYELYQRPAGPVRVRATVTGGRVTQTTWPNT